MLRTLINSSRQLSIDSSYISPLSRLTATDNELFITEPAMFRILDRVSHTHLSLPSSYVPYQWNRQLSVHPVAKVTAPAAPVDFHPISVIPLLSRVVERELVYRYMYPTFIVPPMDSHLSDHYAFSSPECIRRSFLRPIATRHLFRLFSQKDLTWSAIQPWPPSYQH